MSTSQSIIWENALRFSIWLSDSEGKKLQPSTRSKLTKAITMVSENKSLLQSVNSPCDYLWVAF